MDRRMALPVAWDLSRIVEELDALGLVGAEIGFVVDGVESESLTTMTLFRSILPWWFWAMTQRRLHEMSSSRGSEDAIGSSSTGGSKYYTKLTFKCLRKMRTCSLPSPLPVASDSVWPSCI